MAKKKLTAEEKEEAKRIRSEARQQLIDAGIIDDRTSDVETAVTLAMQEQKGGPLAKMLAGRKVRRLKKLEDFRAEQKRKRSKGQTLQGDVLRSFGMTKAATLYDRFRGKPLKAPSVQKKKEEESLPTDKTKEGTSTGALISLNQQLSVLTDSVVSIESDIGEIKTILTSKQKVTEERSDPLESWMEYAGEKTKPDTGRGIIRPAGGMNWLEMSMNAALQNHAEHTAELVIKADEKREKETKLKEANKYSDPEEKEMIQSDNPFGSLRAWMQKKFDDLEEEEPSILGEIMSMLKSKWEMIAPWLSGLWALFGPIVGLAGAAGFGVWLGTQFWDAFGTPILDAVFGIQKWWEGLDIMGTFENWGDKIMLTLYKGLNAIPGMRGDWQEEVDRYSNRIDRREGKWEERDAARAKEEASIAPAKPPVSRVDKENSPILSADEFGGLSELQPVPKETNYRQGTIDRSPGAKLDMSSMSPVKKMIIENEGVEYRPYQDSRNLWTVGVGHLIGPTLPPSMDREFSESEVLNMFNEDFDEHQRAAIQIPGYNKLNENGKNALTDLTFNMGPGWHKKFPRFTAAISEPVPNVALAANELVDSEWYKQVGSRAPKIVGLMRNGIDKSMLKIASPKLPPLEQISSTEELAATGISTKTIVTPIPSSAGIGAEVDRGSRELAANRSSTSVVTPVFLSQDNRTSTSTTPAVTALSRSSPTTTDSSLLGNAGGELVHPNNT